MQDRRSQVAKPGSGKGAQALAPGRPVVFADAELEARHATG